MSRALSILKSSLNGIFIIEDHPFFNRNKNSLPKTMLLKKYITVIKMLRADLWKYIQLNTTNSLFNTLHYHNAFLTESYQHLHFETNKNKKTYIKNSNKDRIHQVKH